MAYLSEHSRTTATRDSRVLKGLYRLFDETRRRWNARRNDRTRRDAFANLLHYDERLLTDMGLTRADVEWAARLPLSRNAALAARERAAWRNGEELAVRSRKKSEAKALDRAYQRHRPYFGPDR